MQEACPNSRSAGTRDSALTVHGVQQASCLADYLVHEEVRFTNAFSSDLSRAVRTAEAILKAQPTDISSDQATCALAQLVLLRERDFGFYEGKSSHTWPSISKSEREPHTGDQQDESGIQGRETKESLARRADQFLDQHLLPLLNGSASNLVVAIISHGFLLSALWRCILRRQPEHTVIINLDKGTSSRSTNLEHLGGWSNTAYLELVLRKDTEIRQAKKFTQPAESNSAFAQSSLHEDIDFVNAVPTSGVKRVLSPGAHTPSCPRSHFFLEIRAINSKAHLQGLKRTGGGVGSSTFDPAQRSIKSFFKKQKTG